MEESPILEYLGPCQLNKHRYNTFKRHGTIGNNGKDISQARHGMTAKKLMEIRSNQEKLFGESDQCLGNKD